MFEDMISRVRSVLSPVTWKTAWLLPLVMVLPCVAQTPSPKLQSLIQQGQAALDAGQFQEAVSRYEEARQMAPQNLAVNRALLLAYLQSGNLARAAELGQDAVNRWPQDADLQHWLGLVYFKTGQNAQGLNLLQRSEKLNAKSFGIHFDIALVMLTLQQYAAAADELESALRLDSSDALAHVLLGRAYQNTNRTLQAITQFQTALKQ